MHGMLQNTLSYTLLQISMFCYTFDLRYRIAPHHDPQLLRSLGSRNLGVSIRYRVRPLLALLDRYTFLVIGIP